MKSTATSQPRLPHAGKTPARPPGSGQQSSKSPLLIGALARASGRTAHTIRWYESQRVIPGVRRDAQGRRSYTQWHVQWLDFVDRLRRTGMSIRQIREYAGLVKRGESSLAERLALLQAQRTRIDALQRELQESLELIDLKIDYYSSWLATGEQPERSDFRRKELPPKEQP